MQKWRIPGINGIDYTMKRFSSVFKTAIACIVAFAVILVTCIFAYPASNKHTEKLPQEYGGILRVWHIDSFEGGVGSRAAFLRRAAKIFEQESGIYVLITVHTQESAALAVKQGSVPDLISYGTYLGFAAEYARPLEGKSFFCAASGGKGYAVPWCRGNYFLFTQDGDFSDVNDKNTLLSDGGTLVETAAYTAGMAGTYPKAESKSAYVQFLGGKYKYMLGTQRDLFRFRTRKAEVSAKPISSFCDLYQYLSICCEDGEKVRATQEFIGCILSEEVQSRLSEIGMLSVYDTVYGSDEPALQAAQSNLPEKGVNVFLSDESRQRLVSASSAALAGDKNEAKILQNILS